MLEQFRVALPLFQDLNSSPPSTLVGSLPNLKGRLDLLEVPSHLSPFLFFAIYASPSFGTRKLLWNKLKAIADSHNSPWLMVGDLNEVLTSDDKFGGREVKLDRALRFRESLDYC
ncbi:hypothetical protein ACSBR2_039159 [Camellia fascicularis]